MKKDVFNGNISPVFRGMVIFSLVLAGVVLVGCGIFFLLVGIFYENADDAARIFLYCFSAFSILSGIGYPVVTLHFIRIYPKHKRVALMLLKGYVFADKEDVD